LPESVKIQPQMNEHETKALLKSFGLPVVEDVLCHNPEDVKKAFNSFEGPAALKILSADILHKTDIGGVILNQQTQEQAVAAYHKILENVKAHAADAQIDGVILSQMVASGIDLILGAQTDPIFGPMVMVGIGGIHAELMKDVTFMRAPVSPVEAADMLERLRLFPLLTGLRGAEPCDLDALANTISAFSAFVTAHQDQIDSFEINPLRALPKGCVALDALAVCRKR